MARAARRGSIGGGVRRGVGWHDLAEAVFNLTRQGRVAFEAQMATSLVVVDRVATQHGHQVAFTESDDVIRAIPAYGSDDAFAVRVLPR